MKLNIELTPRTAIGQNLRVKPEWEILRKKVYDIYNRECQICSKQDCLLDAHELWVWDEESHIQKLVNIIGICRLCHDTIHFDIAEKKGRATEAKEHYIKINNYDYKEFKQKLDEAREVYQRRSRINKWSLDTSLIIQKQWIRRIFYPEEHILSDFDQQKRCEFCCEFYHIEAIINNKCFNCTEEFEEDLTEDYDSF
ncbi:hypothetical protein [Virgibacillus litoralis]|uniref:HNH endonuclease n=1 Tax=Virgibacillus litoralis TaxID=578221 RepID=A0ABS4HID3_9BACI|nr:hypothetical protein [Virgibacillus litoralis]MBP1950680.1 hypothetical protein [Virgibacillus litoralis]